MKKIAKIIASAFLGLGFLFAGCDGEITEGEDKWGIYADDTNLAVVSVNGKHLSAIHLSYANGDSASYTTTEEKVCVTAEPVFSNAAIAVTPAESVALELNKPVLWTITVMSEKGTVKQRTLEITRVAAPGVGDCTLSKLIIGGNDVLGSSSYEISAEKYVINAIAKDAANAVVSIKVDGVAVENGATINAAAIGAAQSVQVTVTNNNQTKTYSLSIKRISRETDATLSSISVNGTGIGITATTYTVPYSVDTVSVVATASSSNATVTVTPSGAQSIAAGASKEFTIKVVAGDGVTSATKTLTVSRAAGSADASLAEILVNAVPVGKNTTAYEVSNAVSTVTVIAVASDSNAIVEVTPSGAQEIAAGANKVFTIKTTAQNGTSSTKTLTVTRKALNSTLRSLTVDGHEVFSADTRTFSYELIGAEDSVTPKIIATPSSSDSTVTGITTESIADGANKKWTITVTNGTASTVYNLTVSYKKQEVIASSQYWTNKDGRKGTEKTISSWSDWTDAERIAQGAAYDDPRTYKGHQEVPYDAYSLYAAYDDTNLYVMVELVNIADERATFMNHNYAGSDNAWWNNRDTPLGFVLNTGKGATSKTPTLANEDVIWGAINFSDAYGFDWLLYASSKYGTFNGQHVGVGTPGFFHINEQGYFSYDKDYCLSVGTTANPSAGTSGITIQYKRKCAVSSSIKFESTPTDNRTTSAQTGKDLMQSETYSSCTTNDLDMSYWYTIPLATLGIDKAYIKSNGIGIRQLTTNGGSLMDCLPWDPCMVDVASEDCSDDASTSKEKEDVDMMTTPQARIGK